jgi:hypothetical protein
MLIWKVISKGNEIRKSIIKLKVTSSRCQLCIEGTPRTDYRGYTVAVNKYVSSRLNSTEYKKTTTEKIQNGTSIRIT